MSLPEQLTILACQIDVPVTRTAADRDQHLRRLCERVSAELKDKRVDLVVLPELCSIDYSREAFERLDVLSETIRGASFQHWRKISSAHRCHVAFSFARRDDDGQYRITLAVVGPDGELVGYYDKIYLAQFGASMEKEFFTPGAEFFRFSINGFRIAPIICADIRFPEVCRTLAIDHGVDVILHSSAYSRDPSFHSWHSFVHTRALENQVFFVSLNRAGADYGRSLFCPPWIDDSLEPTDFSERDQQFKTLTIDRSELVRVRELYPFLKDRREQIEQSGKGFPD